MTEDREKWRKYVNGVANFRGGSRSRDWRRPYGERGWRAYNGVWGLCPSGIQGQNPWLGGQGKLNTFLLLS